jgi:hypothetical protein
MEMLKKFLRAMLEDDGAPSIFHVLVVGRQVSQPRLPQASDAADGNKEKPASGAGPKLRE